MLKAVGIISEYNPFHNGHLYHIKKAKALTHADICVVLMSGNWVQRGQPAILDKWDRTQMALDNGADLVLELPFQFAVQPVDIFAKYSVNILGSLNCTWLSFGSENPNLNFYELSKILVNDHKLFQDYNHTYSSLIKTAFLNKTGVMIDSPNDTLGLNYATYNNELNNSMKLVPIKRKDSNHSDTELSFDSISSASSIRKNIKQFQKIAPFVPQKTFDLLKNHQCINWNVFWDYLKYKILTSSLDDLKNIYQMNEGLEHRFKKYIYESNDFEHFLNKLKTKRYTYARLRRLCVYTLLNFKRSDFFKSQQYVRILGFNGLGRSYLRQEKKHVNMEVISKPNKKLLSNELLFDYRAGNVYSIASEKYEDLYRIPLIF
ncbi:nucleotidyltransferase [Apilactobacillus apisilvae]|uniref:tRNA(Met) cytidine acetate ligase n=1 Tax=Apilactobacillus apisilvae TaxID=2923364 RepID=A0ABY4PHI5_9LACO|nr:nucleotidyltransferase [Apilactobacillus apisilvae]UQS85280.1 nucleotidyltransferase [Apilactobacillus apisilvae]